MTKAKPRSNAPATEVVIEVHRHRRRPRYHRGAQLINGPLAKPEQCNTDDAGAGITVLDRLPHLRRPWAQLCRRCWRGTPELRAAIEAGEAYAHLQATLKAAGKP